MRSHPHAALSRLVAVISLSAAPFVSAQSEDALRGPPVPPQVGQTLVQWSMGGEFRRVEGRPEAAAVLLLDLDDETRARVRNLMDARTLSVTTLLVDRIDDLREITDAVTAGDRELAQRLVDRLWETFEAGRPASPLLKPLEAALSPEQHADVVRLVEEYWDAWIRWELRGRPAGQDDAARDAARREARDRMAFALFQEELRQGYEATLRRYHDALQGIYAAIDPTPEQRAALRDLIIEHIRATRLAATPDQRREVMRTAYHMLDDERKERLYMHLVRQVVPD